MFDELEMLWARLSMPENYADEFSMSHTGVSEATLQAVGAHPCSLTSASADPIVSVDDCSTSRS